LTGSDIRVFGRRAVALAIDWLVLALLSAMIGVAFHIPGIQTTTTTVAGATSEAYSVTNAAWIWVVFVPVSLIYSAIAWVGGAATIGQRVLGLRVYRADGPEPIGPEAAVTRAATLFGIPAAFGAIGTILPGAGIVLSLGQLAWLAVLGTTTVRSETGRGFHDLPAGSVVTRA
jgi:uncharacterized RDD family membrane protein YckC